MQWRGELCRGLALLLLFKLAMLVILKTFFFSSEQRVDVDAGTLNRQLSLPKNPVQGPSHD